MWRLWIAKLWMDWELLVTSIRWLTHAECQGSGSRSGKGAKRKKSLPSDQGGRSRVASGIWHPFSGPSIVSVRPESPPINKARHR